jgi:hypothetical protein
MPMLVSGLVAGLIVGLVGGGRWRNLQSVEIRFWPVLAAGALARLVAPLLGVLALTTSVLGLGLVAISAILNRGLPGAWLLAAGALSNIIVTALNGGMPVDPGAVAASGKPIPDDGLHILLGPETRISALGDVLLAPIVNNIYSVGDVLLAIGGFWMVFRTLRRP